MELGKFTVMYHQLCRVPCFTVETFMYSFHNALWRQRREPASALRKNSQNLRSSAVGMEQSTDDDDDDDDDDIFA